MLNFYFLKNILLFFNYINNNMHCNGTSYIIFNYKKYNNYKYMYVLLKKTIYN